MHSRTNDDLIRSLVAELRPVRRLPGPGSRALCWAGCAALCVFAGAAGFGFRVDLAERLQNARYLSESATLVLTVALAARSAFELGVPNLARDLRWQLAALAMFLTWFAQVAPLPHTLLTLAPFSRSGLSCLHRTTCLALGPAVGMAWMLRRAAPLEPRSAGLFAALSVAALATLGTLAVCANAEPLHGLVWHVAPVAIAALVGSALGARLARCNS